MERLNWFLERIGKKIYRDPCGCECDTCKQNYSHGLIVHDENHARYLCAVEGDFASEGTFLNYRDTLHKPNKDEIC